MASKGRQEPALLGQLSLRRLLWSHHYPSRNLHNLNCNCQLAWLGDWLRKRKIVTGTRGARTQTSAAGSPADVAPPTSGVKKVMRGTPAPGWWGDQPGRAPERRGPLGRGRARGAGHPLSPAPASAWWGLRCDYKNDGGLAVFKNGKYRQRKGINVTY